MHYKKLTLLAAALCFSGVTSTQAQQANGQNAAPQSLKEAMPQAYPYAKSMRDDCVGSWDQQACLKTTAGLSMEMTASYAETLNNAGHKDQLEPLKQHCAASTAATKQEVPAYAMQSALTECVNTISDVSKATQVKPNLNMYQLAVGTVLCLDGNDACNKIEAQLKTVQ